MECTVFRFNAIIIIYNILYTRIEKYRVIVCMKMEKIMIFETYPCRHLANNQLYDCLTSYQCGGAAAVPIVMSIASRIILYNDDNVL